MDTIDLTNTRVMDAVTGSQLQMREPLVHDIDASNHTDMGQLLEAYFINENTIGAAINAVER